ncbi:DUF4830 domain-containing protein [Psychrobacillus sp. NPDC096623]|uniref:DUF4830 domain-containing protein n=1 Tax=Psychrobacillus sp. NPDC096623 TaxID=3364492 RepID=UPI00381BD18D
MRYFFLSAFFVMTLSIIVWVAVNTNGMNEQQTNRECNNTNETISKSHQEYLLQYGWHIKSKCSTSKEVVDYYPELIMTLQSGGLNLEPYNQKGKEAKITTYTLKEEQQNGDKLSATIYEIDGKLVGGYGALENWEPGVFSLGEKVQLIEQGIMSDNP